MGVPINNVTRRVVYAASGTGPYNFTFEILAATDIAVYRDDTLLTLTTNYTVTINSNGTGFVTLTATPTGATQIAIVGNRTISRTTDFVTGGDFFANTLNDELDQQTIFNQQNAEGLQRALQAPQTDPTSINMTLPGRTTRANKTLTFDANGNPTAGVSAADVANAVTYASNAAASATAAAASASAASSSASSASGSASTATTQASNAATSASAASTSASNAATSATNAANSASTATTQASNASTSATNAASSASTASTQASNAATSATNAANSASSASTSATNAANSATAAASSASSAAASAASAATALDSFDDRYLGTKASDPTLDNDGNALVSGALYFSTSQNIMKVYDGASWIAATSAGNTSLLRYRYVATSGQTTFSGSDSNAATLSYTVNNIVVFLNGVSLDQTEYTATNGTSVVLGTGAALNDELVIVAFKSFVTADMVPASTGGTYAGAVRFVAGSASVPSISVDGDTNTGVFFPAADTVAIGTGGTERLRVDSAGNLGLGVTPSAWASGRPAIEASGFSLQSYSANYLALGQNEYVNSSLQYIYKTSAAASLYTQISGAHAWYTAASGTAGNAITFTQAMTLDASGNLGVGTTSPSFVSGYGGVQINGGGNGSVLHLTNSTTGTTATDGFDLILLQGGSDAYVWQRENAALIFGTNNTERARITSGGNFGIGTTSPVARLNVSGGTTIASLADWNSKATAAFDLANPAVRFGIGYDASDNPLIQAFDTTNAARALGINVYGGNVGVGTATPGAKFHVDGTIRYTNRPAAGTITAIGFDANGDLKASSSSLRYKYDIEDYTKGLDTVMQLRPVSFKFNGEERTNIGFIAEEIDALGLPEVMLYNEEEQPEGVIYANMVSLLTKAIQEQQTMIDELKAKVAALENA